MRDARIRERLIAAGHRLFQVRGNLSLSGPEICRAAGVKSFASINQTFGSIDGLILQVLEAEIERYRRLELIMLTESGTSSHVARVKNFVERSTTGASAEQVAAGFLFANVAASVQPGKVTLRARTRDAMVEIEAALADAITAARQIHEVTGLVDPRPVAAQIFASIQKVRLDARLGGAVDRLPTCTADCCKLLGLRSW